MSTKYKMARACLLKQLLAVLDGQQLVAREFGQEELPHGLQKNSERHAQNAIR